MYQSITEEEQSEIEEEQSEIECCLYNQVLKDSWEERKEKNGKYLVCYCKIQDTSFVTEITVDELKLVTRLTIDILEELKKINNAWLNKEKFDKLFNQYITEQSSIAGYFGLWSKAFRSEKIQHIFFEIDQIRKVGGAYASIIAHPQLIQTIIAVYDVLVDSFDDEHLYCTSAYFLLRGIMHINSSKS